MLDGIVAAVLSACIFLKKLIKIDEFMVVILILKLEENMQHFGHIMLYYFKKSRNVIEMHERICTVCGEGAVTDHTC